MSLRRKLLLLCLVFPSIVTALLLTGFGILQSRTARQKAVERARSVTLLAEAARDNLENQ